MAKRITKTSNFTAPDQSLLVGGSDAEVSVAGGQESGFRRGEDYRQRVDSHKSISAESPISESATPVRQRLLGSTIAGSRLDIQREEE
ncbi:hypothetical protein J6590_011449 [Homalodisca vitripennis]|nr:hypothetical protein J6590_011449 [Homalodisca vitripennis]